ncbi:MAG: methyltransferase family protein [Hydrogenophaga sp.]|uniref:methyltransferase family protein n=1 Tax=Hydrogenophaga sp. TaxID=1904254 RepID=UPI004036B2D4
MHKSTQPQQTAGHALALKVPPLALTAITAALMYCLPAGILLPRLGIWQSVISVMVAGAGLSVCLAGVQAFRKSRTTVDPRTPDAASALVTGGIYRYTRNPMYLGFLLVLLSLALYLGKLTAFAMLPAFILYINEFQIELEESALRAKFGAVFDFYAARVRRWL